MSCKKYKKGMTDASAAYMASAKKQEEALEAILNEVRKGTKKYDDLANGVYGTIDSIIDKLNADEKARIYTIHTPFDIINLGQQEKEFLIGALFCLAINRRPNTYQQTYIQSVKNYLGIKEPSLDIDLMAIENVEDLSFQKAMYQVVLEYLVLQDGDSFDETTLQSCFLEAFSINNRTRTSIMERIKIFFQIVGYKGLSEKYGVAEEKNGGIESQQCYDKINEIVESWNEDLHVYVAFVMNRVPSVDEINIEDIYLRSVCVEQAEKQLRIAYDGVMSNFDCNSAMSLIKGLDQSMDWIKSDFEKILHQVRLLKNLGPIDDEYNRLEKVLSFDSFYYIIKEKLITCLEEQARNWIGSYRSYANEIKYEKEDFSIQTGFLGFLERAASPWSYDMMETCWKLREDYDKAEEGFTKQAEYEMADYLRFSIKPRVVELLEEIQQKLQKNT